jgi:hypothetical protein
MDLSRWFQGVPPVGAIRQHEVDHPTPINVTLAPSSSERHRGGAYWLCVDLAETRPWMRTPNPICLTVREGRVWIANGLSFWQPLDECTWPERCKYLAIDRFGLPASTQFGSSLRVALH